MEPECKLLRSIAMAVLEFLKTVLDSEDFTGPDCECKVDEEDDCGNRRIQENSEVVPIDAVLGLFASPKVETINL